MGWLKKVLIGVLATSVAAVGSVGVGCLANKDFKNKVFKTLNISKEDNKTEASSDGNSSISVEDFKAQLEITMNELQSTKAELETTKQNYQSQVDELENELIVKNQELETTRTQLTEKVSEFEVLSLEKAELQGQLETANTNINTLQVEIETVNSELGEANSNIETLTARKTELEEQLTNANEDISSLQSELNITDSNLQQAYDDIESLQARRSELEHLLQTEQTNVANLTSELETANADIESKQNEILSLTNQLSEKENQIETLTAEKLELEETISEKDARIEELGVKISNLENSVVKDFGKFNYYVEGGKSYYMHMLDNGNLFMSNNGLYLYDFYDATFTEIIPDNVNFNKFYQSGDELLVITTSSQYVVNINTLEATKIGTYADTSFSNFFTMNDGCVVVYGNKYLVYVYNPADKTFVTIEDDLYRPTFVAKQIYEDKLFLYGSSFFAVYDNNTKTITQLIDGYNGMSSVFKLSNNNALITSTQVNGLWLYDSQANTVTTITTDSFANHDYMFETPTGYVICASLISNSYIGLYNINTGETSKFTPSSTEYTTGYNHFIEDENGVTITRNDGKDCDEIYFDYSTNTFIEL